MIPRAAAEVTFQTVANVRFSGIGVLVQQIHSGHDHARGAEAALQAVALVEGGLHRVQRAVCGGHALVVRDAAGHRGQGPR